MKDNSYDFSFSGVKSAVLNYLNQCKMKEIEVNKADVAASFQAAVVEVLVDNTIALAKEKEMNTVALAGGVAANQYLRAKMKEACEREGITLKYPAMDLCTDNAAMIGSAAYFDYKKGVRHGWDLNAVPGLRLGEK